MFGKCFLQMTHFIQPLSGFCQGEAAFIDIYDIFEMERAAMHCEGFD